MKQIYSKIILALVMATFCGTMVAQEDFFEADGLRYKLTINGGCEVTAAEQGTVYSGDIVIPAQTKYNGNEYDVIGIGDGAFDHATITNLKIGKNVRYVGDRAFSYSTLTKLNLPANVDSLAPFAFNCEIRDLNIEDGDTRIKFSGWGNIYTDSVRTAYIGRIYEDNSFNLGYKVESVTFGPKLDLVPRGICYGCKILKQLELGTGVKIIEEDAFLGVESLENINISDQIEEIRGAAFYNGFSIKNIHFGSGLKLIGQNSFTGIAEKW